MYLKVQPFHSVASVDGVIFPNSQNEIRALRYWRYCARTTWRIENASSQSEIEKACCHRARDKSYKTARRLAIVDSLSHCPAVSTVRSLLALSERDRKPTGCLPAPLPVDNYMLHSWWQCFVCADRRDTWLSVFQLSSKRRGGGVHYIILLHCRLKTMTVNFQPIILRFLV